MLCAIFLDYFKVFLMQNLEDLDISWNVQDKKEWPSEQDLWNVSEWIKKAQKVWWQIQSTQAHNRNIAKILTFILNHIDSDSLLWSFNLLYEKYNFPLDELILIFLPFLPRFDSEISEKFPDYKNFFIVNVYSISSFGFYIKNTLKLDKFNNFLKVAFNTILENEKNFERKSYTKDNFELFNKNFQIDFIQFLIYVIKFFDIWDINAISENDSWFENKLKDSLYNELFKTE